MDPRLEHQRILEEIGNLEARMAVLDAWDNRFAELASRADQLKEQAERLGSLAEIWPPQKGQSFDDLLGRLGQVVRTQCYHGEKPGIDAGLVYVDRQLEAFAHWLRAQLAEDAASVVELTSLRLLLSSEPGYPISFRLNAAEAIRATNGFRVLQECCAELSLDMELLVDPAEPAQWDDSTLEAMAPVLAHYAVEVRRVSSRYFAAV